MPTPMQSWRLTLLVSWEAGPDYDAAHARIYVDMDATGLIWGYGVANNDMPLYPNEGPSIYGG